MNANHVKHPNRVLVEELFARLRNCRLTKQDVAAKLGIEPAEAIKHMSKLDYLTREKMHNVWYYSYMEVKQDRIQIGQPNTTYKPEKWAHETARPDSQDHLKCLSRRGDNYVEHRPAMAQCVGYKESANWGHYE